MKKIFLSVLFVLSSNAMAHYWFPVQARVNVTPQVVSAVVQNIWGYPVVCRGEVIGWTYYGAPLTSFFNPRVIYAGQFATSYVYSNFGNPFINGAGNVYCRAY